MGVIQTDKTEVITFENLTVRSLLNSSAGTWGNLFANRLKSCEVGAGGEGVKTGQKRGGGGGGRKQ